MHLVKLIFISVSFAVFCPFSTCASSSPAEVNNEIDLSIQKGSLLQVKERYEHLLQTASSDKDRNAIRQALDDLNIKLLFSKTLMPEGSFLYTVQAGDFLAKIAKKNHTTVDLIKKSNALTTGRIYEGMKLKLIQSVFSIEVDVSKNRLFLYADHELIKTYPVATGKPGHPTPLGTFTIVNKIENPDWRNVPFGDPENILGTRWMGFSLKSYGIHGTALPQTIGTTASDGCIRMFNHDVEELFTIVPTGAQVTVVE